MQLVVIDIYFGFFANKNYNIRVIATNISIANILVVFLLIAYKSAIKTFLYNTF